MLRKTFAYILSTIFITLFMQTIGFALGDGNIDGGGGSMGQGTSENYWIGGDDGVRVTVIRDSDNANVSTPVDFTNKNPDFIQVHFGKISKVQYRNGYSLTPTISTYTYINPGKYLPRIISSDGSINIDAIKDYFTDELAIRYISQATGFEYDTLISGEYKLLLEPIAYFTYGGLKVAMTAHEAALYDQVIGGNLRSTMPSLTHKNLPLAMFLETSDLGFPAWDGSTSEMVTDSEIISSLGLGIVRFREADPPAIIGGDHVEYRVDTDAITSVTVTAGRRITPDNPAAVTFNINGVRYMVTDIVIPAGESQIVWVKWHTPREPTTITITASVNRGAISQKTITARIIDLSEKIPPDPAANDIKPDGYTIPQTPVKEQRTFASWGVWSCYRQPDSDGGDWKYEWTSYYARLSASVSVKPDGKVPTAYDSTMKSGYGINLNVKTFLDSNAPASHITGVQNMLSYYPEFGYNTYLRLSDRTNGGYNAEFDLKQNKFSTYNSRVHFTPIWFPDGRYAVYAEVIDLWTPGGMLTCSLSDYVNIQGNLYDDWHIAPKK